MEERDLTDAVKHVDAALQCATLCAAGAMDLSNELLLKAEAEFSALHDRAGLVWKFFAVEKARRQRAGTIPVDHPLRVLGLNLTAPNPDPKPNSTDTPPEFDDHIG